MKKKVRRLENIIEGFLFIVVLFTNRSLTSKWRTQCCRPNNDLWDFGVRQFNCVGLRSGDFENTDNGIGSKMLKNKFEWSEVCGR